MSAGHSWTDRLNPVLVKEVRASLRGRLFRILFSIVALGSVTLALILLADLAPRAGSEGIGREFARIPYMCLSVAVLCFVPITSYLSMGSEWDEHTYELLEISNLRPRQIVLGKLFTAGIESLLYTSIFLPLFVFAFLLRGVDIVNVIVLLGWTLCASFSASALALALSTVSRLRPVRVLLLAIVAVGSIALVALSAELAGEVAFSSWRSGGLDADEIFVGFVVILGFGLLGTVVAVERVTHAEENHSTAPRLLVLAAVLVCQVWLGILCALKHATHEDVAIGGMLQITGLAIFHVFFTTELEALPRRVRLDVSPSRTRALLSVPFLPGGARGLLHFVLCVSLVALGMAVARGFVPASSGFFTTFSNEPVRMLCMMAWFFALLGAVSLVTLRWSNPSADGTTRGSPTVRRWLSRILIGVVFFGLLIGPPVAGFFFRDRQGDIMHPLNPYWVLDAHTSFGSPSTAIAGTFLVAALVALANVPRCVRAVRDVLRASDENRARAGNRP